MFQERQALVEHLDLQVLVGQQEPLVVLVPRVLQEHREALVRADSPEQVEHREQQEQVEALEAPVQVVLQDRAEHLELREQQVELGRLDLLERLVRLDHLV